MSECLTLEVVTAEDEIAPIEVVVGELLLTPPAELVVAISILRRHLPAFHLIAA